MDATFTHTLGQALLITSVIWAIWRIVARWQTSKRFTAGREWFSTRPLNTTANHFHHISEDKVEFGARILARLSESLENNHQTVLTQFERLGAVHLKMSFLIETSFVDEDLFKLFAHLDRSFHQIYSYRKTSAEYSSRSQFGVRMESLAMQDGNIAWAVMTDMNVEDMHDLVFKRHPLLLHGDMVAVFISVSIVTPETVSYYDKLRRDLTDEQS